MKKTQKTTVKLIVISLILILILLIGTMITMRVLLKDVQQVNGMDDEQYRRHYAYIHTDKDLDFWSNVYEGAVSKGNELGVYIEDFGTNLTADYDKKELINIAIAASVDGIIVDGDTDPETIELIDKAKSVGIPVITVLDDCNESDRIAFVGVSSYAMGRQYGEEIIKHYKGNEMKIGVLLDSSRGGSAQELAVAGISDIFKNYGINQQINIEGIYINGDTAFSAEEDIRDIFLDGDLPDAMVALNSVYTRCLFQAIVDYNRVGNMVVYGFHDSTDIIEAVSKKIIDGSMSVNARELGSSSVEALEEYWETGYVSEYITQDTQLILTDRAKQIIKENENND